MRARVRPISAVRRDGPRVTTARGTDTPTFFLAHAAPQGRGVATKTAGTRDTDKSHGTGRKAGAVNREAIAQPTQTRAHSRAANAVVYSRWYSTHFLCRIAEDLLFLCRIVEDLRTAAKETADPVIARECMELERTITALKNAVRSCL